MKRQRGFTLIELLIVIAILGILSAVAIPSVIKFIGTGNLEAANIELSTVETSVAAHMAENGLVSINPVVLNSENQGTELIGEYLSGQLKGAYNIASNGEVTGLSCQGLVWDATIKKWAKP